MAEYVKMDVSELIPHLRELIVRYNQIRGSFLTIYASAIGKPIPDISMIKDDYYSIFDLVRDVQTKKIDIFLETPGGSGETAEEIANFLHEKFNEVSFVISGEAKSAGTILALSGHQILMTKTGSLGPIDAQVRIGRSWISAYDYIRWVEDKKKEAQGKGELNPFDATMIAQISPGELCNVFHALKFAEDLVIEWLPKYKFSKWSCTKSRRELVTDELKKQRAEEIAQILTNHADWRSHGRSIKIKDLEEIVKLEIIKIDENVELAEIVYRIHTVVRMIFAKSNIYKIFATEKELFRKIATSKEEVREKIPSLDQIVADVIQAEIKCPQCNEKYTIYVKTVDNPQIDKDMQLKGFVPFPKDNIFKCKCGYEIDLSGLKNDIETKTGKKIVI